MCGDGNSFAIMLDHRCTALGRDFNSQVLKHREFGIIKMSSIGASVNIIYFEVHIPYWSVVNKVSLRGF